MYTGVQWSLSSGRGPHRQVSIERGTGDAWAVFCQTTRMFCEDLLWPCSQELSPLFFSLCLGLHYPLLSPPFLSPCQPSHRATLPFISHPHTSQPSHTAHTLTSHPHATCDTHTFTLHTQTRTRALLVGWPASSTLQSGLPSVRSGLAGHSAFAFSWRLYSPSSISEHKRSGKTERSQFIPFLSLKPVLFSSSSPNPGQHPVRRARASQNC